MFQTVLNKVQAIREKSAGKKRFIQELLRAVDDGQLTLEEVGQLDGLREAFGLTDEDIGSARVEAYNRAFAVAKADGAITTDELNDLRRLQSYLGLSDQALAGTQKALARLRLLTEVNSGQLPTVAVSGIVLQKSEMAHWQEAGTLLEERVVSRRYEGGSSGVSFRIMKGVTYRVGAQKGRLVSETGIVPVSNGELVITSKRVLFHGDLKSFALKHEKLLGVELYSDGIRITAETGKPRLVRFTNAENAELIGAILSQAINRR